ncbi:hypothetical protein ACLB2K_011291 [Fragaria x ananassa]
MQGFGVGFRFHPTERELVGYFLRNRASMGSEFRPGTVVECRDFYGKTEPWVIWDSHGGPGLDEGESLYFFTERHRLHGTGNRFNRKVGSGTWSAQRPLKVEQNGEVIGMKREFRYERGSHPDQNNCWLMQEFEMDVNDSLVLCTLRKKPSPAVVVAVQESNTTRKRNDPCGNDDSNHLKRLRLDQPTSNSTAEVENLSHYDCEVVNVSNSVCVDYFKQWLQMVLDEDPISDALLDECLGDA